MDRILEYSALISNRKNLYRFLGRIYKVEVDQILLDQMKEMNFPDNCAGQEISEGYRMIEHYLRQLGPDPLTDLAVDYARVFLGAGIAEQSAAYPYESVYTSPKRLIMQEARDEVLGIYRQKGLNTPEALDLPEDHIAFELEFMAYLCQESQQAIDAGDWAAVSASLKEQLDFLNTHLLNWTPQFCDDIKKYAETDFYKGIGNLTNGYLSMERTILEDIITEIIAET